MLRKILLTCVLSLSGCALFKTNPPATVVTPVVVREELNIEVPVKPDFEKSKSISWKVDETNDVVSTSRESFSDFLTDLINYSKYTAKLEESLQKYKEYVDKKK